MNALFDRIASVEKVEKLANRMPASARPFYYKILSRIYLVLFFVLLVLAILLIFFLAAAAGGPVLWPLNLWLVGDPPKMPSIEQFVALAVILFLLGFVIRLMKRLLQVRKWIVTMKLASPSLLPATHDQSS